MKEEIKVSIIQTDLFWENPDANLLMFSEKINGISEEIDLIVLPEMFTTGFTMNAKSLAELENGKTLNWMKDQAHKKKCAITGSVIITENQAFYNRLFFVYPNGDYKTYDKRHTFTLAGEHHIFKSGKDRLMVDLHGWKICPLICYDLRFPVWARNTDEYDILLYVANWPERRISAWDVLLKARSIENMTYCIGVNRTGNDGNGHQYIGHSAIYNVLGEQISTTNNKGNFIETIKLNKSHIEKNRSHLQFLNDGDKFTLN